MIRDSFYRHIVSGLKEKLDPELFEQCATDLLRAYHPTIAPIRGGCDGGQDGAISDGKGLPYPLISTTEDNVIRNLTKSLKSYLSKGGPRRKVIVATSQELTPRRRRNLENRAAELEFTLIQTYDQAAFADLLYRDPAWCKELLNLAGDPPPLSVLPITRRLLAGVCLIGRKDDFKWLKNSSGDLLLVGQPGSGKTFLFHKFAKEGDGLFVISQDPREIARGIRSQQPKSLIVDDAHLYLRLIDRLRHLRTELDEEFRIVASCWPGQRAEVAQALNIPGSSIRALELLIRDQIVEVIKSCGIRGPNHLIRELVNQADGKPGLAATLCYICLNGSVREVALGDALSRDIRNTFEPLLGSEATTILASFAIGGDQGMPMVAVAQNLGLPLLDVREVVTRLAAGGVLSEVGRDSLSVRPPTLRYALVRDTFFKGATSLPSDGLIRQAGNISDVTLTLIGSQARGSVIRQDMLQDLLTQSQRSDVWRAYCSLGATECSWVLDNYPEKLTTVAFAALRVAPIKVIPLLLSEAISDDRELAPNPEHPLRLIKDWVKAGRPGTGETINRREILLESVESWYLANEDLKIATRALEPTISPQFEDTETDPGSGRTFTFRRGSVTYDELIAMQRFWPRVLQLFRDKHVEEWEPIQKIVAAWAYPGVLRGNITEEFSEAIRSFACVMLKDLCAVSQNRPAILHWAQHIADDLDTKMEIDLNPEFEILFPKERFEDREKYSREQAVEASSLAKSWSKGPPDEITRRLIYYEQEAKSAGIHWPRLSPFVCQKIAESVSDAVSWATALIEQDAMGDLIYPFIVRAMATNRQDSIDLLETCIKKPALQSTVIPLVVSTSAVPDRLVKSSMSVLDKSMSKLVEFTCRSVKIPEDRIVQLLLHKDPAVACAAAIGEWHKDPKGIIDESHKRLWRTAIINFPDIGHSSKDLFESDPSLACDWLEMRIRKDSEIIYRLEDECKLAINLIGIRHRRRLLAEIPEDFYLEDIIKLLVGDNLELFGDLLSNKTLRRFHLVPLQGHPDKHWVEKALMAIDAGYSPEDLSDATYGTSWGWAGSESDMWGEWNQSFEWLLSHENPRIQGIGQLGQKRAGMRRRHALERERQEAIYGIE